jgi:hypothetical protein
MTRRVVKGWDRMDAKNNGLGIDLVADEAKCPYGQPSDKLWVRETWAVAKPWDYVKPKDLAKENDEYSRLAVDYKAEKQRMWGNTGTCGKTRPSIHMPRWASRITLEVTAVRVERLQEITVQDIEREGAITQATEINEALPIWVQLWDGINAERGFGWAVNPFVWVVEFKRIGGAQ